VAKPQLGVKRNCLSCGAKFYDLNRDPILCPKCGAQFMVQAALRRPEAAKAEEVEEESVADPAAAVLVPLEEADADPAAKDIPGDDIEVEEDIGAEQDDTFLEPEEEEDGGDVSDLIGGDIEEDEET
jgi:uncharacterized protein (TIGR02300 family)